VIFGPLEFINRLAALVFSQKLTSPDLLVSFLILPCFAAQPKLLKFVPDELDTTYSHPTTSRVGWYLTQYWEKAIS